MNFQHSENDDFSEYSHFREGSYPTIHPAFSPFIKNENAIQSAYMIREQSGAVNNPRISQPENNELASYSRQQESPRSFAGNEFAKTYSKSQDQSAGRFHENYSGNPFRSTGDFSQDSSDEDLHLKKDINIQELYDALIEYSEIYHELNCTSKVLESLKNLTALSFNRVRSAVLAYCNPARRRASCDRLSSIANKLNEKNMNEEDRRVMIVILEGMGAGNRRLAGIVTFLKPYPSKYVNILGECFMEFLTENGQTDFETFINMGKGSKAKEIFKNNRNFKLKMIDECERGFGM